MALELGALYYRVSVEGADAAKGQLRGVREQAADTARGMRTVSAAFSATEIPLMSLASAASVAATSIGMIGSAAAAASGVGIAARFQRLEVGFATLLGSAEKARGVLAELRELGAKTDFKTEELIGFSRALLATGSNARTLLPQMQAIVDTAAALGLQTWDVGRMITNLGQIRAVGPQERDLQELLRMGVNLDKVVGAATGRTLPAGAGMTAIKGMTGEKAFETLIRGMNAAFGGAAARNAGTFLGVLQNIGETLANSVLPTGRLLLTVLGPLASSLQTVLGWLQQLNEVTGGGAGLIAMTIGLWRAKNLLIGSAIMAATAVRRLTTELEALALAARVAGMPSAGGTAPTGGTAPLGGRLAPGGRTSMLPYGGMRNAVRTAGAAGAVRVAGTWLRGMAPKALGAFKVGWPMLADIGGNLLGNAIGGDFGRIISGTATGIGYGAMVGSFIPGVGTAAGAVIGGTIGLGKTLWDIYHEHGQAQKQIARNTAQTAAVLKDIKGMSVGGGKRFGTAVAQMEVETALARMMGLQGGVA